MELAIAYASRQEERSNTFTVTSCFAPQIGDSEGVWNTFHQTAGKTVAVFAGRDTGKTYNMVLRAMNSTRSSTIFVQSDVSFRTVRETIRTLERDRGWGMRSSTVRRNREMDHCYFNGKTIRVRFLDSFTLGGISWTDEDIYVDEFELIKEKKLNEIIRVTRDRSDYNQLLCIGSICHAGDSLAKRFFKSADTRYFIDKDVPGNTGDFFLGAFPLCSLVPSSMNDYISKLPTLD